MVMKRKKIEQEKYVYKLGMLAAKVAELGLSPKPEWIENIGDDIDAGLSSLMNSHLSDCIAMGSLPELGQDGVLPGRHFVMIEDFVDVSKPIKFHQLPTTNSADPFADDTENAIVDEATESSNGSKNRVLKMVLTDGVRRVTAIEVVSISEIPQQLVRLPGAKLIISGSPDVCAACVLLYPYHVKFLGGFCPQLQIRYKQSLAEKIARADPLRLAAPDSEAVSGPSTQTSVLPQPTPVVERDREATTQLGPQVAASMLLSGQNNTVFGGSMPSNRAANSAVCQPSEVRATLSRGASLPVFGDDDHVSRSSLQRVSSATASSCDNGGQMNISMGTQNLLASNTARPVAQSTVFNVDSSMPTGSSTVQPSTASITMSLYPSAVKQEPMSQDRSERNIIGAEPLQERLQNGSAPPSEQPLKRARSAGQSEISATQPMNDGGEIQRITEVTPVSAITLSSSGSENAAQSCDIEDLQDFIEASQEIRQGGGAHQVTEESPDDTSLLMASVRAVSGRKVVLDSGINTFIAEVAEGDPPVIGYHGFFLVWRDIANRVFASVRSDGISSGELAHLAQSLDDERFED